MNTRKLYPGGEIEITNDEINLMPEANREGMHGINAGIGSGANMIISGVGAVGEGNSTNPDTTRITIGDRKIIIIDDGEIKISSSV